MRANRVMMLLLVVLKCGLPDRVGRVALDVSIIQAPRKLVIQSVDQDFSQALTLAPTLKARASCRQFPFIPNYRQDAAASVGAFLQSEVMWRARP